MTGRGFVRAGGWCLAILLLGCAAAGAYAHWPSSPLPPGSRADRLVLHKARRELLLIQNGQILRTYRVALGRAPVGAKAREGDDRTPEGAYVLDGRNTATAYHLSLHISYPNAGDVQRARKAGVDPGGAIMIHGLRRDLAWLGRWHRWRDWTRGCVALTNPEMDELGRLVPMGTPIQILP